MMIMRRFMVHFDAACTEEDYIYLENLCLEYCNLWENFGMFKWDIKINA